MAKQQLPDFGDLFTFDSPPEVSSGNVEIPQDNVGETLKPVATEMDFSRMKPFPGHIFQLYEGQQLADMVDSIRQFGILLPIILWDKDDSHIILSGHNRVNAAKIAGLTKGPVVVKTDLSQEDAILIVTETNLRQRSFSDLSHSERALCLAQHYEAMKCQGRRTDLISEIETLLKPHDNSVQESSAQVVQKLTNREKVGGEYGLSHAKVARYIRLATLNRDLLSLVDSGEIAFLAAYDLSFIEESDSQSLIADTIKTGDRKVDMKMAALLREYYEKNKLTEKAILQIMSGEKTGKPRGSDKPKAFSLKSAVVGKYFTAEQTKSEIEQIIDTALSQYFAQIDKNGGDNVA
ncbi:MAG: ParB N-terminal domain-containing protein [Oscillospiraceae bacterium]|nr:ParB N-terminal domain-containing protein [Oscillospiraceae bacterium]